MPGQPQRANRELASSKQLRQILATEKTTQDVTLTENGMRNSDGYGQEGGDVNECGHCNEPMAPRARNAMP